VQILPPVTENHEYFVNKTPVAEEDPKGALVEATRQLDQPTIVLRLDRALSVQDLVNVLQIGTEIRVKMILATQNESS